MIPKKDPPLFNLGQRIRVRKKYYREEEGWVAACVIRAGLFHDYLIFFDGCGFIHSEIVFSPDHPYTGPRPYTALPLWRKQFNKSGWFWEDELQAVPDGCLL